MASQVIRLLKQSGDLAVREANDNLRIPGFKQLEGCHTTVDMDVDPEVFVLLEPIGLMGKKVILNSDIRKSTRRLRSVFTATISFFRWRLPNGESMLRENGLDNIPIQIFEEIKASLVQTDMHFSRFSPMAIKRCLRLFMESFLPQTKWAPPIGTGNTTARDCAREA